MEKCSCKSFHCESLQDKTDVGYVIATNRRFRYVKEDGCITDEIILKGQVYKGGVTEYDIPTCRKSGEFKPIK